MEKINVTKSFLPPIDEFNAYVKRIYQSRHLTNQGPLLKEFEDKARTYLGLNDFQFVANGTLALEVAIRALDIENSEIITTPFSYVATTSAILWTGNKPVYADIDPDTLNINPRNIERLITAQTKAILAVHVFGSPCDVEAIENLAKKHNLKVIYDGAHAFGVQYKDKSLLSYGDIATCSFHATKLFHTIEGGCIVSKDKLVSERVELMKRFGHHGDEHFILGINAKASEFQAAMGLCNLKYIDKIIKDRHKKSLLYDELLAGKIKRPKVMPGAEYNYSYYPVILPSKEQRALIVDDLKKLNIFPRRYFYPSLNTLPYLIEKQKMPVSEDVASRILCLPLYSELDDSVIEKICGAVNDSL